MDRNVSTAVKNNLFGSAWKSDIKTLKNFKNKFLRVKNIELFLPYAIYKQNEKDQYDFIYIDKEKHENLTRFKPHSIFYVTLFLREGYNKQTLGIELTADAEVVPQLFNRKKWYYYEWDKNKLTIRRILGTYDENRIEDMIKELMQEFKRFYLIYCKTK